MTEKELKIMIQSIMSHPLFVRSFYSQNKSRIVPVVEIIPSRRLDEDTPDVNAYAGISGDKHLMIKITTDALDYFTISELKAVLGHELCHLKYQDYKQVFLGIATSSIFLCVPLIFALKLVSPLIILLGIFYLVYLIRKSTSARVQRMEYRSDEYGAGVSSVEDMISALSKLDKLYSSNQDTFWDRFKNLFHSHPMTKNRIKHLQGIANGK